MKTAIQTLILICLLGSCKGQTGQDGQTGPTPEQQAVLDSARANFVYVKGGTFMMGREGFQETTPVHEVTLSGYSMAKYETTLREYDLYTELEGLPKIAPDWRGQEDMGPDNGALSMDWQQARDYCLWLGKQLDLPIDLPTEAQWEYAARSRGLDVAHGTDSGEIEGGINEVDNYGFETVGFPPPPPNPLGLYDMSGGLPEWTLDWWKGYRKEPVTDPVQDSIHFSEKKVVRGTHTLQASIYRRTSTDPKITGSGAGLRCVCNLPKPVGEKLTDQ